MTEKTELRLAKPLMIKAVEYYLTEKVFQEDIVVDDVTWNGTANQFVIELHQPEATLGLKAGSTT